MEPCPHPFSGTFLTVVGVYRRLCISIVLAAFEKAVELGFFQPLRVVGKPREKGMVVVIDLILGSFAERFGDVTVEIKILHLVAQVPEVKVSLQLLDSNETLRQLRMVIGVPRGTLGCGLLDYRPSRIQS